ncbi:MAG TPA: phage portal protein [Lactobacillus sp.]|nr:phage portal protein [Lactobacillus sp.]
MPLEADLPELDNQFLDHAKVTHHNQFLYPADEEITSGDLLALIDYHRLHIRPLYLRDRDYYEGHHAILDRKPKEPYKPDNRLVINFPRKAVTTFNGFFDGTPVKIDHPQQGIDTAITTWENINNFEDTMSEVSKASSIYGRAYFYVYQDETGQPCVAGIDPLNTFLIYDDTVAQKVKYGVHYGYDNQGYMTVSLISTTNERTFTMNGSSANYLDQTEAIINPFPIVPIIEAPENKERMAMCADIYSIFDELDKAMSEKANDVDYFADAYLKIVNAYMTDDESKAFSGSLRDNRLVVVNGSNQDNAQVDFMSKPNADTTQENLIDRLVDYIYQIASVTNMNDEAFGGNPSGVTLRLKYQPMKDMAATKSQKFKKSLFEVFQCVLSTLGGVPADSWQQLQFKFTQSIPQNLLEESQTLVNLYGKVSNKTAFAQMSFIDDPDKEIEQKKKEQQEDQTTATDMVQQALAQQKGGVADDNHSSTTPADSATDTAGQSGGPSK